MDKFRVLVDGRLSQEGYKWGKHRGLGHYCSNLLTHLPDAARPSAFKYLVGPADIDPLIREKHVQFHAPDLRFHRSLPSQTASDLLRLPGALRTSGCDIVHFLYHLDAPLYSPLPVVVTVPDLIPHIKRDMYTTIRRAKNRLFLQLEKAIIKRAAAIIAISEQTKRDLQEHLGADPDKVTVTPLGVERRFFLPVSTEAIRALRLKFGLPESFLLYLGGIDPRKNVAALVDAWALLVKETSWRVPLVLAGRLEGQPEYPALKRQIDDLGLAPFVFTTGFVPEADLPTLFAAAKLFVFPSLYEGFGLPVLQSMAAGCPVLAVRASSVLEVAGDTASYVAKGTAQELAGAITEMLEHPAHMQEQRARGQERANGFTWERTARETIAVYERVAETATQRQGLKAS